jgi:hypothetical protein
MAWQAVVYWDTQDRNNVGWSWRVQDLETGQSLTGPTRSVEEGIKRVKDALSLWGVDPATVEVEILDEGVWDKC